MLLVGGLDAASFDGKKKSIFFDKKLLILLRILLFFVSLYLKIKGLAPRKNKPFNLSKFNHHENQRTTFST